MTKLRELVDKKLISENEAQEAKASLPKRMALEIKEVFDSEHIRPLNLPFGQVEVANNFVFLGLTGRLDRNAPVFCMITQDPRKEALDYNCFYYTNTLGVQPRVKAGKVCNNAEDAIVELGMLMTKYLLERAIYLTH